MARPDAGLADHAGLWLVQVACENKVYALFALLFGAGIALQRARSGERFVALHCWRMGALFLIGVFHLTVLWSGDILATYALLGIVLLPFRARPARTLVRAALVTLALPTLALAGIELATAAFAQGAAQRLRVASVVTEAGYPARQACFAFAMFLLGLAAARERSVLDAAQRALQRRLPLLLALGLAGSVAHVALVDLSGASVVSWTAALAEALAAVSGPGLALAWAALLLRALERPGLRRALAPLAAAGRLSLTNYLLQSVLGVTLLAKLGSVHPPAGIALASLLFAVQVAASRLWAAYFRFGPVEWLWRALSYGRLPPLRA